jgi:hypothetical protein
VNLDPAGDYRRRKLIDCFERKRGSHARTGCEGYADRPRLICAEKRREGESSAARIDQCPESSRCRNCKSLFSVSSV